MSSMNSLNYCPGCGSKIRSGANFCMECGYNIGKLRQIIEEADKTMFFSETEEKTDLHMESNLEDKLDDTHQELNKEQPITTEVVVDENELSLEENNIQSGTVNDIELVRPDFNDNNNVRQPSSEHEKQSYNESIQIEMDDSSDSNDFDIVRPNSQKKFKKETKDFSILNSKQKN